MRENERMWSIDRQAERLRVGEPRDDCVLTLQPQDGFYIMLVCKPIASVKPR
jgi:hypothetical protein